MNQREQFEQAIVALEAQRALLGDTVVEASLAALRAQLAAYNPSSDPQRKQVTVLFADVSGFTALSETRDAEDVRDTMNALWQRLDDAIIRYGGTIDKHIGDALMALFGAPTAAEDDPERAIHAALVMQAELVAFRAEHHIELAMRIGINTGPVLLGAVGSTAEYTAMGDAVNLASRLEHAAPVGGILIGHATYRHVRGIFDVQPREPFVVKGKVEPVRAYVVLQAKPRAFRIPTRGVEGIETRMIGREIELQLLQDAFETAIDEHETRFITIVGEAGVGKSRLLYELINWLDLLPEPIRFFKGRASPERRSAPYALIRDVLTARFDILESDDATTARVKLEQGVASIVGADGTNPSQAHLIGHLLGLNVAGSPHLRGAADDPRAFQERALAALLAVFTVAEAQPTALLLEDIHWADDRSLDVINTLLAAHPQLRLLIICLTRPTLFERRPAWGVGQLSHTRIDLRPLTKRQSRALVDTILQHVVGMPGELRELIVQGAEGNPFYVEELIKMLIDDGVIVVESERWRVELGRLAAMRVPPTLTGILQARLDSLPAKERALLQQAAVVGRIFWDDTVAQLHPETDLDNQNAATDIHPHLMTLYDRELIYPREHSAFAECAEYIFKHALLRDVTYESVLKRLRKVYHAQVAAWLVAHSSARIDEYLALIAEHYIQAEDHPQAIAYLLRAGDRARAVAAYTEASNLYERAVALLRERQEHGRAARTLMKLGLTYHQAFDFARSRQAYEEGFALWHHVGAQIADTPLPAAPHPLRRNYEDPRTLDPAFADEGRSSNVIELLFSGLVEADADLNIVPALAQSWEILDEGRRYVFHLREDARWSDGAPLTAEDVLFAWRRVLDPTTQSPVAEVLFDILGAEAYNQGTLLNLETLGVWASDAHTLEVELAASTGYFLALLAHTATYPVPRHIILAHGNQWTEVDTIVSSGAFRLMEWRPGELLACERNPMYSGVATGNVQRIELQLDLARTEDVAVLERYAAGHVDLASLPPRTMDLARQRYPDDYIAWSELLTTLLGFNLTQPPFDDVRVRRAFAMVIDKETLWSMVYRGYGMPGDGGYIPPGMPGHSPRIGLLYDPMHAQQLLVEAGYPAGRGLPSPLVIVGPIATPVHEYLTSQWREHLGVELVWEGPVHLDGFAVLTRVLYEEPRAGDRPHMYYTGWLADYPDPDNFLRVGLPESVTHWRHAEYASLVEQARRSIDQHERLRLYGRADRILIQEAVVVPLGYGQGRLLVKPWVTKYPTSPIHDWFWKDVVIEPHE